VGVRIKYRVEILKNRIAEAVFERSFSQRPD
jgi:hypothetical protein